MTLKKININKKSLKNLKGGDISMNEIGSISYPVLSILKKDLMLSNYGSNYKTTGGGKLNSTFNDKFIRKGMRNIDNYMNKKVSYNNMVNNMSTYWMNKKKQTISDKDVKGILSDLFHSNYKTSDKSYSLKRGGSKILLPAKWFHKEISSCPQTRQLPSNYSNKNTFTNKKMSCLLGGSYLEWNQDVTGTGHRVDGDSTWFGSTSPPNMSQNIRDHMTGVSTLLNPPESSITHSQSQNFCSTNNCYTTPNYGNIINPNIIVKNITSDAVYGLDTPSKVYSSVLSNQPIRNGYSPMEIPNQRA